MSVRLPQSWLCWVWTKRGENGGGPAWTVSNTAAALPGDLGLQDSNHRTHHLGFCVCLCPGVPSQKRQRAPRFSPGRGRCDGDLTLSYPSEMLAALQGLNSPSYLTAWYIASGNGPCSSAPSVRIEFSSYHLCGVFWVLDIFSVGAERKLMLIFPVSVKVSVCMCIVISHSKWLIMINDC